MTRLTSCCQITLPYSGLYRPPMKVCRIDPFGAQPAVTDKFGLVQLGELRQEATARLHERRSSEAAADHHLTKTR